ncbi:MAG TPA: SdpI family protein [Blastocatellia bacterium]|nr:SdpI family protein [Blastocatellia bacterium]
MTKRLTLALIVASYAASAAVYPKVPDPYLTVDPHQSTPLARAVVAFLLPTAAVLTYWVFSGLSRRDPTREHSASFGATFDAVVLRIILLILGLHSLVLASLVSGRNLVTRAVPVLAGLTVVAIGDLLPRLRPNIAIGFRAPWTLNNRSAWIRTHRFAGYATVLVGLVIIIAPLVLPRTTAEAAILAAGVACALALVCYSCRISRSAESSVSRGVDDNAIN